MINAKALRLKNEAGEEVPVHYDDEPAVEHAVDLAIEQAKQELPPNTVFEIRGKMRPDDPINQDRVQRKRRTRAELAEHWGVGWYWASAYFYGLGGMEQQPLFRDKVREAKGAPMGGYIVIARCRT